MAHTEQQQFVKQVKFFYPQFFKDKNVLDVGSLDINGNNSVYFDGGKYLGIDITPGPNVDKVIPVKDFKTKSKFDVVISTECFEHDKDYKESIKNICENILAKGGLFVFTAAAPGRPEHGTTRTSPKDSPATTDYYKNLSEADIRDAIDIESTFETFGFQVRSTWPQDIYFFGIKK